MNRELAETVKSTLLDLMSKLGVGWNIPWVVSGMPRNAITLKNYRGANVFILGLAPFASRDWATYRAWHEAGAQVTKGEKATHIFFWKKLDIKDRETDEEKEILMARAYAVFNREQVTGAPELTPETPRPAIERHAECERILDALNITTNFGGDRAFYVPSADRIQMPKPETFTSREGYYGVRFHEAGHATGHESRLNRPLIARFGSEAYAFEELIAETTSALCCAATGISPEPRADHAQYLNSWMTAIKTDKRAIFTAFSKAQAAADFILTHGDPAPEPSRPGGDPEPVGEGMAPLKTHYEPGG